MKVYVYIRRSVTTTIPIVTCEAADNCAMSGALRSLPVALNVSSINQPSKDGGCFNVLLERVIAFLQISMKRW